MYIWMGQTAESCLRVGSLLTGERVVELEDIKPDKQL
jgi:hypothetical protein